MKVDAAKFSFYLQDDKKLQDNESVLAVRSDNPGCKIYYCSVEPSKLPIPS